MNPCGDHRTLAASAVAAAMLARAPPCARRPLVAAALVLLLAVLDPTPEGWIGPIASRATDSSRSFPRSLNGPPDRLTRLLNQVDLTVPSGRLVRRGAWWFGEIRVHVRIAARTPSGV